MDFNLTVEPWIPVVGLDGSWAEASLVTVLLEAHRLRRIVGQTPPMTAALHRLVIAFAHRIYGPENSQAWAELWTTTFPDDDRLRQYLRTYHQRFELFDSTWPFQQCPGVAGVAAAGAAKLVPYRSAGNNTTLFDHTTSGDEVLLSPAEAARWLVTLQAYDPGGLKTPFRKDKSSQLAQLNRVGMVLVEGGNLKETLLLNMQPYNPADNRPRRTTLQDRAVWEADPPGPEPDERHPLGWTDLLTWPSRRAWLSHRESEAGTVVDKVVITPGTRLKADLVDVEGMAAHQRLPLRIKGRRTGRLTKKLTYRPWYSVRLHDRRGIWRHSQELLLAVNTKDAIHRQRPGNLEHVAAMDEDGHLPEDAVYTLRVIGQQLDSKAAVVEQVLEETVAAPVALLRAKHETAGPLIGHSVELADLVGLALINMERDHRAMFQARPSSGLDLAYWPRLAEPFDEFLQALSQALNAGTSPSASARTWSSRVRVIAEEVARRWAEGSPRQGRNLEAAGACYGQFVDQLNRHMHAYRGRLAAYFSWEQ